jgi:hypothetical protein
MPQIFRLLYHLVSSQRVPCEAASTRRETVWSQTGTGGIAAQQQQQQASNNNSNSNMKRRQLQVYAVRSPRVLGDRGEVECTAIGRNAEDVETELVQ